MANVLANLLLRVRGDTKQAQTAMGSLSSRVQRFNKDISLTRVALAAVGFGIAAKKVFDLGAAVGETASMYSTVFGPAVDETNRFLNEFANKAGLSRREAQELSATAGAIAQGFGFAQAESAKLSNEILNLSGDFASFRNLRTEDTMRAITSAITGEREQLKQMGIVIREVDVQQRALTLSGKEAVSQITNQEKATATLALITEQAGVIIGDLDRTQSSAANRAKQLSADLRDVADTASLALQPAFSIVLDELVKIVDQMKSFILVMLDMAPSIAGFTAVAIQGFKLLAFTLAAPVRIAFQLGNAIVELGSIIKAFATGDAALMTAAQDRLFLDLQQMERAITDVTGEMLDLATVFDTAFFSFKTVIPAVGGATTVLEEFDAVAQRVEHSLTGVASALGRLAGGGGFGGFLKSALSIGAAFIPTVGPFASAAIQSFDSGGTIGAGQTGIVGERGPELVSGPATVTGRGDTAAMMGGDTVVNIIIEQGGVEVRRITKRQRRNENLGLTHRLALPAPAVG